MKPVHGLLADQKVNWSELARKYGLHQKNGGQTKEFLAANGVPLVTREGENQRNCQEESHFQ